MMRAFFVLGLLSLACWARPLPMGADAPPAPKATPAPVVQRLTLARLKPSATVTVADNQATSGEAGELTFALPRSARLKPVKIEVRAQVLAGEVEAALVDEQGQVLQGASPRQAAQQDTLVVTVPKAGASLRLALRPGTRYRLDEVVVTTW